MSLVEKRWVVWGIVAAIVALVVLSFVLPYVGDGDSGLTKILP
jgi:ABC-type iron transport system FetAB permease component